MPVILSRAFSPQPSPAEASPTLLKIVTYCPDADTVVVVAAGEADLSTVPDLRRALQEASAGRSQVLVDLDAVSFMDASTLGVLVEARLRMSAAGGILAVRCRSSLSRRLLAMTGLDFMLDESPLLVG